MQTDLEVIDLDGSVEDADWIKQRWDLPPYKSADFLAAIPPEKLDWFRSTVTYKAAVEKGLIHDDEWVGDYCTDPMEGFAHELVDAIMDKKVAKYSEDQPRDSHGRFGSGGTTSSKPDSDVVAAIKEYTARGGPDASHNTATSEQRAKMESWISSGVTGTDKPLYQGTAFSTKDWEAVYENQITPGSVISLGSRSFTEDKDRIGGYKGGDVFVHYEVVGGMRGRDIQEHSFYRVEQEHVGAKGQHFRVLSADYKTAGGIWKIKVEAVGVLDTEKVDKLDFGDLRFEKVAIDTGAHEAATSTRNDLPEPSGWQKENGVYRKGHINVGGVDIAIENPAGSRRKPGWPILKSHYGFVKRTSGADGEEIDCFVRPGTDENYNGPVYIIDQVNEDGSFDEQKIMIGWKSKQKAVAAYLANYKPGWKLGDVTKVDWKTFKDWVDEKVHLNPVAN
jgi:hypothetical protein